MMIKYIRGFIIASGLVAMISGCVSLQTMWKDNILQRTLTKETLREHKPEGAYLFGTVEKGNDERATGLILMMADSPDLYLPLKDKEVVPFLIDVPFQCTSINKIGIRYNYDGSVLDQWVLDKYKFNLLSNTVRSFTNEQISIMNRIENNTVVSVTNKVISVQYVPQVYYIGRFSIKLNERTGQIVRDSYKISLTNKVEFDQQKFMELYPVLTNADFVNLDVKLEK